MKILVHTCCAPCLTYTGEWLIENDFNPASYYYNPNIYPEKEYVLRYFTLKNYAQAQKIPLIFEFDKKKLEAGNCSNCYEARLRKTAEYAKNKQFNFFTTTLLVSPYQNHELLKETGRRIGDESGVEFFYYDFREGYGRSRELSRQLGLYRQKYCGCEVSYDATKKTVK